MKQGLETYGPARRFDQWRWNPFTVAFALILGLVWAPLARADARTLHLVALGDSLTAGYQLPQADAFPTVLEGTLRQAGVMVEISNAGVSGDTASDGAARVDWSVPDGTDGVLVELGANDMLRGLDPKITRQALADIITRLQARHIAVYLMGMRAAPSLGAPYVQAFEAIYPDLAATYHVPLDPFFLEGMAGNPKLTQADGLHPTAEGVRVIVARVAPQLADWAKTLP